MTSSMATEEDLGLAEASAWLARLQREDIGEQDGLEFEAWLAAAPGNRAAYTRAVSMWHEFEATAPQVQDELATRERHDALRLRRGSTRRWWMGAGGMAIAASLAVAVLPGIVTQQATAETYATGKGERKRVTLADGSLVDMNAETKLSVTYARAGRKVDLAEGEAIFDVVRDAKRPFTVAAANREVRVLGTQFDVRQRQGDLMVTVARGKVQVRPLGAETTGREFTLTPGQRLEVARSGHEKLQVVDPQEAFSWRAGRLIYRGEPLANVVADLNRQYVEQIEVSDPELGKMPVTGVIVLDDQSAVVARLSLMLPVRSVPSDRGLLLLRK